MTTLKVPEMTESLKAELRKQTFKAGDKVQILIGGGDPAYFGMAPLMRDKKGTVQKVDYMAGTGAVCKAVSSGGYSYAPYEVRRVKEVRVRNSDLPSNVFINMPKAATHIHMAEPVRYMRKSGNAVYYIYADSCKRGESVPWRYVMSEMAKVRLWDNARPLFVTEYQPVHKVASVHPTRAPGNVEEAPREYQTHDELVAENESLQKQIEKLEERLERKKAYQRDNVAKIAAWQTILDS